jgi:hypothetical protein
MVFVEGEMEIETIVAAVTLKDTEEMADPSVAVMLTDPGASPVTTPLFKPILATVVSEEDQFARLVMFRVPPSLNVPMADN